MWVKPRLKHAGIMTNIGDDRMPKIPLEPNGAPIVEAYKYFHDKLFGKITYKGKVVAFDFESNRDKPTYPMVYLDFYRQKPTTNLRYIGDEVKVRNLETGNFELRTIGEPFEGYWKVVVEGLTREANFAVDQQIRVLMGRTGCVYTPFYIEHSRYDTIDWEGDNSLVKKDSDKFLYVHQIGYRVYFRLSGGYMIDTYLPTPPVEDIVLTIEVDQTVSEEVTINDESDPT